MPSKESKAEIINQAFEFHTQGNIPKAIKYYETFIKQGFKDPRVFSNYGLILHGLGKFEEAELNIRKAIDLNNDFPEAYLNLGNLLKDLGKLEEAKISIRKAIELSPNYANAYSNLGNLLRDLGELEEAELSTRKAIELKPDLALAHYFLGLIFTDYKQLEQAETSFKQAIKLKFGFVQAHDALAHVLVKLGREAEAEEISKKVLYLKSIYNSNFESQEKKEQRLFNKPNQIEYPNFYTTGMGTENVGAFLRSMVMMLRPKRVLEIGAGYTTPFLLEGLINNERVFDDGNLSPSYFQNYIYDAKLVIIDIKKLTIIKNMQDIINSKYTDFIEGKFEGKGESLFKTYGFFDFVWFDCGTYKEYINFIQEFWKYCSNYVFFHFTYTHGEPNINHKIIRDLIKDNSIMFDIVEPHKKSQGSITMVKKEKYSHQNP